MHVQILLVIFAIDKNKSIMKTMILIIRYDKQLGNIQEFFYADSLYHAKNFVAEDSQTFATLHTHAVHDEEAAEADKFETTHPYLEYDTERFRYRIVNDCPKVSVEYDDIDF